jgi:hypothetical protein
MTFERHVLPEIHDFVERASYGRYQMKAERSWRTFTVDHPLEVVSYDPNKWTITRINGIAAIHQDGMLIDEPPDTGQSDVELIR